MQVLVVVLLNKDPRLFAVHLKSTTFKSLRSVFLFASLVSTYLEIDHVSKLRKFASMMRNKFGWIEIWIRSAHHTSLIIISTIVLILHHTPSTPISVLAFKIHMSPCLKRSPLHLSTSSSSRSYFVHSLLACI